jgi:hypothetical protein
MTSKKPEAPPVGGVHDELERAYIEEYLRGLGLSLAALKDLPEDSVKQLMRAASLYASTKLSEVENRSHFVEELHGGPHAI